MHTPSRTPIRNGNANLRVRICFGRARISLSHPHLCRHPHFLHNLPILSSLQKYALTPRTPFVLPLPITSHKKSFASKYLKSFTSKYDKIKQQLQVGLRNPDSSIVARWFHNIIMLSILGSFIVFCIGSMAEYYDPVASIETIFFGVFAVEIILTMLAASSVATYLTHVPNIIDLAATIPYIFELTYYQPSTSLPAIRLFTLFRIWKLRKYSKIWSMMFASLAMSLSILGTAVILLSCFIVIIAAAIYYLEHDGTTVDGKWVRHHPYTGNVELTPFFSIPAGFCAPAFALLCFFFFSPSFHKSSFRILYNDTDFALTTIVGTGYGDQVPYTLGGRVVAGIAILMGVVLVSFPISVVSCSFSELYFAHMKSRERRARPVLGVPAVIDRGLPTQHVFLISCNKSEYTSPQFSIHDLIRLAAIELDMIDEFADEDKTVGLPISCDRIIARSYTGIYATRGSYSLPLVMEEVKETGIGCSLSEVLPDILMLELTSLEASSVIARRTSAIIERSLSVVRRRDSAVIERSSFRINPLLQM